MATRFCASVFAFSLLGLAACSASTSTEVSGGGSLSDYCTGTLTREMPLVGETSGGGWGGDSSASAKAGTSFLLAAGANQWAGYVIADDGAPLALDADPVKGLVEGTDFTSSCAPSAPPLQMDARFVFLADVTLYANADLTDTSCAVPAGTAFTNFALDGGEPWTFSSPDLAETCGTGKLYATEIPFGYLIDR